MKETLEKHVIDKRIIFEKVTKERNGFMKNLIAIGTVFALFIVGAFVYFDKTGGGVDKLKVSDYNLVTIDINPSVGLMVDNNDKVVEVLSLNDDAVVAMEGLNLVGLTLDDAIDKVIDNSVEMGYISELSEDNVVNVTTYLNNEEENKALNDKLRNRIESRLVVKKINALVIENGLNEEIKKQAEEYDVSYGKMLLITRATNLDETLEKKALVDMTIKEIQESIKKSAIDNYKKVKSYYFENEEEIKARKEEIIENAKETTSKTKATIIERIENYNNLSEPEKEQIIEEKKEQIKEAVEKTRETIENGSRDAINAIREKIENRRGN